jgi:hypothetical protein
MLSCEVLPPALKQLPAKPCARARDDDVAEVHKDCESQSRFLAQAIQGEKSDQYAFPNANAADGNRQYQQKQDRWYCEQKNDDRR